MICYTENITDEFPVMDILVNVANLQCFVLLVYGPPGEAECKQDSAALKNKLLCILA